MTTFVLIALLCLCVHVNCAFTFLKPDPGAKQNLNPIYTEEPKFIRSVKNGKLFRVGEGEDAFDIVHVYGEFIVCIVCMDGCVGVFYHYIHLGPITRISIRNFTLQILAFGTPKFYTPPYDEINHGLVNLGPGVQRIVSLTSSLRGQLVKCL